MKTKVSNLILSVLLATSALVGCGSTEENTTTTQDNTQNNTVVENNQENNNETETAGEVITIAASTTPHAEILAQAQPLLEELGYTLEITEFSDYVMPNNVVESDEIDANYFQHIPYLDSFNEEQGTHLVSVGEIHYEPFGIYAGTENDITDITEGATIAIPNDTTNEARALLLLEANGIIKLREDAGLTATILDIEDNYFNVEIVELEAAQIARVKDEMSFIVLNGNYALQADLSVANDALAYEDADSEGAKTYVNIIVVKEGNEENAGVLALVDVLKSETIVNYINETYDGAVIPFN